MKKKIKRSDQEGLIGLDEDVSRGETGRVTSVEGRFTELVDELRAAAGDNAHSINLRGDEDRLLVFDDDLLALCQDHHCRGSVL